MERPTLGSLIHIHELQRITLAPLALEKLNLIFRMGGAKAGKMLGERLMDSGLKEQEAVKDIIRLIEYCKAGKITLDETIRISENCERFGHKTKEPSCHFTTGFLNGFFYVVKNQHVRETKCIAAEIHIVNGNLFDILSNYTHRIYEETHLFATNFLISLPAIHLANLFL